MSIEKLKEELRKFVEFDRQAAVEQAIKVACHEDDFIDGARFHHAKSARYAEQLLQCVEVLEFYADEMNHVRGRSFESIIDESGRGEKARELLAKLSKGDGA